MSDAVTPAPRTLVASIDGRSVGMLAESKGIWQFTYTPDWLARKERFALSPALSLAGSPIVDGGSERPVQWYFDNLLPEEAQRQLMAADAHIRAADAFGLLGYYGAESAGSLTLLPPGEQLPPGNATVLSDEELSRRIRELPKHSLAAGAEKRMSLAGAQHKLAVILKDGQLWQPTGAEPSTHILKPDHPGVDYPHSVINEWFVMTLARRMGLIVPTVYRRYVPEPVYLIERFDRTMAKPVKRLHAIDACQLLNLDRQFKYQQGSIDVMSNIIDACRNRLVTRWRLYDWLVFNVLTGNGDAHLKNLSFLVDPEGVNLAPHYDLLSTVCYGSRAYDGNSWPSSSTLAWPIKTVERFADLDFEGMVEAGTAMGLSRKQATERLTLMCVGILDAAKDLLSETEDENEALSRLMGIGITLEGESRCLRTIVYVVIKEMVDRMLRT